MSKESVEIVLSENHIAKLINGEELSFEVGGKKLIVRQSYMKDIVADMLVRNNRVMNTVSNTFEY